MRELDPAYDSTHKDTHPSTLLAVGANESDPILASSCCSSDSRFYREPARRERAGKLLSRGGGVDNRMAHWQSFWLAGHLRDAMRRHTRPSLTGNKWRARACQSCWPLSPCSSSPVTPDSPRPPLKSAPRCSGERDICGPKQA